MIATAYILRAPFHMIWICSCALQSFSFAQPIDTLPVVVHVMHTGTAIGSPGNPSDASIVAMIGLMNEAFQKNGPLYGGADVQFAFALAVQSPNCNSSTGINRINASGVPSYATGGITTDTLFFPNSAHELSVKSLSRWPNTDYINIWLVNMIDGFPNGSGGYAYYPQYNSALTDGIVIRADLVGGTDKIIIHELGHYFNLDHPFGFAWEECEVETDCTMDGDQLCDTENMMFTFDCDIEENPCTGNPWEIADAEYDYTVLNNYMGYTPCAWMFTEDQKMRMHDALFDFRPGLLSSNAGEIEIPAVPASACIPTTTYGLSPYYGIQTIRVGDLEIYSNSSAADGAHYVDRSCHQQVEVRIGENIPVHIVGSYFNYQHIKVYLDKNGDGVFGGTELLIDVDAGEVVDTLAFNSSDVMLCEPLRLRVVTDPPGAPEPTPCMITGVPGDGAGQVEDIALIVRPRIISSVANGNWNTASTWDCNCVPVALDEVVISNGHVVVIPLAVGTVSCAKVILRPGASLNAFANVNVTSACN